MNDTEGIWIPLAHKITGRPGLLRPDNWVWYAQSNWQFKNKNVTTDPRTIRNN